MPRPTEQSLPQGTAGFGPDQNAALNLGNIEVSPVHQLDVDGATENARMLAAVFQKGTDVAQDYVKQSTANGDAQGAADASLGQVDPAKLKSVMGYADGAKRVATQTAAVTAANQAKALFQQNPNMSLLDTTDANGNTVPGLTTSIDNIFRNAFPAGAERDPVTANLITPIVQHTMNEITGAAYQHQILLTQQSAEDSQTALVVHDAQNPGAGLFNVPMALDTLTKVYGGDARQGRDALVHSVGEAAVQAGDPSLIAKYLPNGLDLGSGATLTSENLSYLDGARNRATLAQTKGNEQQLKSAGMSVVQTVASGKDPMASLNQYAALPGASPEFYRSMVDWFRSQGADKASRVLDSTDAAQLQSDIALGKVTTLEQAQQDIAAKGYTSGAAVQLVSHAASWLDAKHNTDEHDPQFIAARDALDQMYRPGINPLTGQFTKPQDVQTHANVLSDFITQYQQKINAGNIAAADAAHQASDAVQKKYGAPSAMDAPATTRLPASDVERASYLRNSANMNADGLNRAGINPDIIKRLRDANQLDSDTAATALKTWLSAHQGTR